MKKTTTLKAIETQKLESSHSKHHSFFSLWGLAVMLLITGGILVAFDYVPIADYMRFSKDEKEQKAIIEKLQQDIELLQENLKENRKEFQQLSSNLQENLSLLPEAQKDLKEFNRKAFWVLLLNLLNKKILEGSPFGKILHELEGALPSGAISLGPLKFFAASGIPSDEFLSTQLMENVIQSLQSQDGLWEQVLGFFSRLVSIQKIDISTAQKEVVDLIRAHKLPEALSVLRSKLPEKRLLIQRIEQKIAALTTMEDLEFFITSNLQESHVL